MGKCRMIYTVTSTLPLNHGGRTKSILSRVKFLDEELNIPTKILTTNYNANYKDNYELFLNQEKITKNIQFENIYDWLSNFKLLTHHQTKFFNKAIYHKTPIEIEGLNKKVDDNENIIRYYNEDEYTLYRKYYEGTEILEFEDFMSPINKRKLERWQYNKFGILHRKLYFSHDTQKR